MDDAKYLLYLKNDPGSRVTALMTQEAIAWVDHVQWLRKTLLDPKVQYFIILDQGEKIGSWRFDLKDPIEFSMIIDPILRGKRYGSRVFSFCSDYAQQKWGRGILGYIAEGNVRAMRYHIANDYQLESYDAERKCYVWTRSIERYRQRRERLASERSV